ncbi:KUP/HAK/KT family potassium transporter [Chitinophagaceae bacterium MMS25-I14]
MSKLSVIGLLVALGIIYGDIGTSPLYVFRSIIGPREISPQLVYGGISCVFWTLTLQTTFKYVFLTLRADNRGEGGIFSLYALVRRYGKWLYIPTILGAATLLADGIITPPITVASAIEGLNGVKGMENIIVPGNNLTVGIVIAIISLLFLFQRFGTDIVGKTFGPMMFAWFTMIMVLGLSQVIYHPQIFAALNPYYAFDLLINYPHGFWLLGAVFLCTTGAEALYSDLGHCGRKNIQVSWAFVKVTLVINYLGQGAWLLAQQEKHLGSLNPFFEIMPHWFLLAGIIIATFASIIASQALISGSFTLISEAISMNFWPRAKVKFPSTVKGQIYIPSVNWILCIGCIAMILYFRESGHMEAAYGFSIVVAMLMTSTLMYMYMKHVRKWPMVIIVLIMAMFLVVETSFFITNAAKIKQRWMFLFFEFGLMLIMFVWYKARKITNRYLNFVNLKEGLEQIVALSEDQSVPRNSTHLVYLTKANNPKQIEKRILDSILHAKPKRADIYWFIHIDRTDDPYAMEYQVTPLVEGKVMRIDFNLGFRVQPRLNWFFKKVLQELYNNKEISCKRQYESLDKKDFYADIAYVVIERFLSIENEFSLSEGFILETYFSLKRWAQNDQKAFGLDYLNTVVEYVPLVIQTKTALNLKRIGHHKEEA